jgi:hypothetical protein
MILIIKEFCVLANKDSPILIKSLIYLIFNFLNSVILFVNIFCNPVLLILFQFYINEKKLVFFFSDFRICKRK